METNKKIELAEQGSPEVPSLIKYISSNEVVGFDTGDAQLPSPSTKESELTSIERQGDEAVVINHQRKQSVSISMPLTCEEALPHETNMVFFSDEVGRDGVPISAVDADSKSPQQSKYYSQPMPKAYVHPTDSSPHGAEIPNHPGIRAFRDKRFDSFKTWSGTLERQISMLRGKSPRHTREEENNNNNNNNVRNTERPVPVDRYFDALEGPELETLRSSEEILLPQDSKWPFLLRFPVSAIGICLGVSSQAILWKTLASSPSTEFLHLSLRINLVLWFISIALVITIFTTYLFKIILYFEAVRREYYHPIRVNFFFAPWIALLFLALGVPPSITKNLHHSLWYILMTPIFCLELKIYGQWMSGGQRRLSKVANPSNHLSVVGNFVGALLGATMGLKEGPIFFFAIGLAHYTVLFVTLYQRLPTNETLPKELHPVFFLFVAAPSVASMAWAKIQPLYHAYMIMTSFLWVQIFSEYQFIKALWKLLSGRRNDIIVKLLATTAVSIFILEFLVNSFTERKLYTWCFLITGVTASIYLFKIVPWRSGIPIFVCIACWFLSIFTLMPAEIPDNNQLVVVSGAIIIIIGIGARWLDLHAGGNKYWLSICNYELKSHKFSSLFYLQALLVALSSVMVYLSTTHRTEKRELLAVHQLINWSVAGISMILPLFSENSLLSRLTSIFLGFAPPFLLLSIGYEAIFYAALALVLMAWILFENTLLNFNIVNTSLDNNKKVKNNLILGLENRSMQLSDVRIPLVFMVLFNIAFFGTGNFASIASFEISSVYRFITIFSPFLMAALLIFKLFIPFMLVICVFSAITKLNEVPRLGCYFLVILFSDVMTIHFFFLVRNTGSWMEIGNSISHFGIMSAQVVFVLLLFALTNTFTKDIQCNTAAKSARAQKAN